MKNHFYYSYCGNKRDEVEKLYTLLKLDDVNIIVEPFCGTCAFSYYLSTRHPKKYKYILNDYNKLLTEILLIVKDEEKMNEFEEKINHHVVEINKLKNKDERKQYYSSIKKLNTLDSYLLIHKYYTISPGLCKLITNKAGDLTDYKQFRFRDYPIYNFLKNEDVEIFNLDAQIIYDEYKNNINALMFIDPPYLFTNNSFYNNGRINQGNMYIYEYLSTNDICNEKAKIYLILENIWINKLLFKNNIIETNEKTYQPSKSKTSHITISNQEVVF